MFNIEISVNDCLTIQAQCVGRTRDEANQKVRQALRDGCRGVDLRTPAFAPMEAAFIVSQEMIAQGIKVMNILSIPARQPDQFVQVTPNDKLQTWRSDGIEQAARTLTPDVSEDELTRFRKALKDAGWTPPNAN